MNTTTESAHLLLLTVRETAEALRVSERHVRRLIETGDLKAVNYGHKDGASVWRISVEALNAFVNRHSTE